MPQIKLDYDGSNSLTVTGFSSLANGGSATSAAIDNSSSQYLDILMEVVFTTDVDATANTWVEVWAKGSLDNTDYSTDSNDYWVDNISVSGAGATTNKAMVSLVSAFPGGVLPPYVQVRLKNATGDNLAAGTVAYMGVMAQTV